MYFQDGYSVLLAHSDPHHVDLFSRQGSWRPSRPSEQREREHEEEFPGLFRPSLQNSAPPLLLYFLGMSHLV